MLCCDRIFQYTYLIESIVLIVLKIPHGNLCGYELNSILKMSTHVSWFDSSDCSYKNNITFLVERLVAPD